ncbi:MAG: MazG family protein [Ardenticatenales bacterium]|nr:MazG family protein [Ardenticatenales bacterium]
MTTPHPSITILGLGPGSPDHLTLAAAAALAAAADVHVRTTRFPGVAAIPSTATVIACDDLYAANDAFPDVYAAIAARIVDAAARGPVVYAVPGDPAVGETTVGLVRLLAAARGIDVVVLPGVSFIGPTLSALGWDALDGVQVADATELGQRHHPSVDPDKAALVAQVYSRIVASDVKLVLQNQYPDDHPIYIVSGAGSAAPSVTTATLSTLDHAEAFDDVTTIGVPPLPRAGSLLSLADVIAHLRAPDGCPWDREQTHESLRPYLLEEAYEAVAAIDAGDPELLAEELGDVLLQVVLHSQLAVEAGDFNLSDVIRHITEKLIRRHPHVFGDVQADTPAEVLANWDQLKAAEKAAKAASIAGDIDGDVGGPVDPFADIPPALPALMRAQAVQRKSAKLATDVGPTPNPPPELGEGQAGKAGQGGGPPTAVDALRMAVAALDDTTPRAESIGQALWAVAALARAWGVDAETALRDATGDVERRVRANLSSPGADR